MRKILGYRLWGVRFEPVGQRRGPKIQSKEPDGEDGGDFAETLVGGQRNIGRVHGHAPSGSAHNDLRCAASALSGELLSTGYIPGGGSR